jgi:preprotein translocase subunit SecD
MVSVVVLGILFLGSRVWPRMGFETHAAVRFEVRLAEVAPAPGLREARVSGDRSIYLHQEIVVSNADIASAEVLPGRNTGQFLVSVHFTPEGTQKMRAATLNHIGRPVAILIDDEVVMAPTLRSAIGESAEINGDFTKEEAERIVDGIQ